MKISDRKINIGITVFIGNPSDSVFTNGIRQNVIILRDLFSKCRNINNSYIINVSRDTVFKDGEKNSWSEYKQHIITLEEAADKCDLIVVGQGALLKQNCDTLKKKGIKLIKQVLGAELSVFNESILFKENDKARLLYDRNNGSMSGIWISPHFFESDKYFFETRFDAPAFVAPYVWDPRFIQYHIEQHKILNKEQTGFYKPTGKIEKRISSVEPNINMVKTSTMPVIISELFYRKYPQFIDKSNIFCSSHIRQKKDMVDFVKNLDIYKAKKMFFESRYPIVTTLLNHSDILLSHQNQCELNYVYLDTAWMGFPLVHNSNMMKDLGWYYHENNANKAIEHLAYVAEHFDNNEYQNDEYLKKSRAFAYRYMIDNPENVRGYERLIQLAMDSKI